MNEQDSSPDPVRAKLGLWDAISIIVGIVIGAGIFETAPFIFQQVSGPWTALGVWALGGLLSLIGALCYAELATTYPHAGGDYVYLTRAFGRPVGFLFGWAQLSVILPASIALMAFVFSDYAVRLWNPGDWAKFLFAAAPVAVLTALNILGSVSGKWTQNVLTAVKVVGLGGILYAGFMWGEPSNLKFDKEVEGSGVLGLAMILVLYTYGGWNDAAFVAAEVRNPKRNIPWALIGGIFAITTFYILVNAAYILAMGFEGARQSKAIAADVLQLQLGDDASRIITLLVMVSALGAVNGLILTGSRVYWKVGSEHRIFAWFGRWNPRMGAPLWSLIVQGIITVGMVYLVGSPRGQEAINELLVQARMEPVQWRGHGGFETVLITTAPIFWFFFLLSGLSLFALREKDRNLPRGFTVPLYPFVPFAFCAMCLYMLYSAATFAVAQFKLFGYVGWALLAIGLPLYLLSWLIGGNSASQHTQSQSKE